MKELCGVCQEKIAVWIYMPGYGDGSSPYLCDEHVHRGCSCNWNYSDKNAYFPPLDDDEVLQPKGEEGVDWKWIVKEKDSHMEAIEKGVCWTPLDEKGREYPCCEYEYDEDGFDKD